LLSEVQQTKIN